MASIVSRIGREVAVLDALDVSDVRRWSSTALDLLDAHRDEIDALNVFPVADSDTGSNALTTLRAADAALTAAPDVDSARAAFATMADGAARDAHGNSGFIVSQILRGLAAAGLSDTEGAGWDAAAFALGLDSGTAFAHQAVVTPVAGTILTVVEAAAHAARAEVDAGRGLGDAVVAATLAADAALQRTTEQLPELARAGVVDAGGRVLLLLLDALARTVTGSAVPITPVHRPGIAFASGGTADGGPGYGFEVQFRLDAAEERMGDLRSRLAGIGDSVAVVSIAPGTWNVHVHVDDVGAVVEAGMDIGRPHDIVVSSLRPAGAVPSRPGNSLVGGAVLAVAPGAGLAHLFENAGVDGVQVVTPDLPAVADVVAAVHASGAAQVVLLPNASRVAGVAEAAAENARAEGIAVSVVPTRSPVQALAAIAVHDPARRFDDDVVAMAEAAAATRYAEIVVADTEALTAVGTCLPGDVLGLIDGEVVGIGRGMLAVVFTLVDRLLAVGAELITVLVSDDAPARTGDLIAAHVRGRAPLTDVTVYATAASDYPVIIGVE